MIITFNNDDLPTVDAMNEPGRVVVVTPGTVYREWGRIASEGGEVKYPKNALFQYDLGSIDVRQQDSDSVRWRVELGRNQATLEFYFIDSGIVCAVSSDDNTIGFEVLCAESAFSGYVEPSPEEPSEEGTPRFERVG